eukprot:Opistho-2@35492
MSCSRGGRRPCHPLHSGWLVAAVLTVAMVMEPARAATTFGRGGSAVTFNGNNALYWANAVFPSSGQVTLTAWLRTYAIWTSSSLMSYAASDGHDNTISISLVGTAVILDYTFPKSHMGNLFDGRWHHLAFSYNASCGCTSYFVDGVAVLNSNATSLVGFPLPNGGTFIVGQEQDALGGGFERNEAFSGQMDDLRIYDKFFTAQDVGKVMAGTYSGTPFSLYTFDADVDLDANGAYYPPSTDSVNTGTDAGSLVPNFPPQSLVTITECNGASFSTPLDPAVGRVTYAPVWGPSSAPIGGSNVVAKARIGNNAAPIVLCRDYTTFSASAQCCNVTVLDVVAGGSLVLVDGTAVVTNTTYLVCALPLARATETISADLPYVYDPINSTLLFVPTANFDGKTKFRVTATSTNNPGGTTTSASVTVRVVLDRPPTPNGIMLTIGDSEGTRIPLQLWSDTNGQHQWGAKDNDGDYPLAFYVTSLPTWGFLYQSTAVDSIGSIISTVPTLLLGMDGRVVYVPSPNQDATYDFFTFCASDVVPPLSNPDATCVTKSSGNVTFTIKRVKDVPQTGGFKLDLDGVDDGAYLNATRAVDGTPFVYGNGTVSFWLTPRAVTPLPQPLNYRNIFSLFTSGGVEAIGVGALYPNTGAGPTINIIGSTGLAGVGAMTLPLDTNAHIAVSLVRTVSASVVATIFVNGRVDFNLTVLPAGQSSFTAAHVAIGDPLAVGRRILGIGDCVWTHTVRRWNR